MVHVPLPVFVSEVALPLPSLANARPRVPLAVPERVSVRVPAPLSTIVPEPVRLSAPEPDASMVPLFVPRVNRRLEAEPAPVYWTVPPLITRLAAALVDLPR